MSAQARAAEVTTCYACGASFDEPDFFLLVVAASGNVYLYDDLDGTRLAASLRLVEVERCPECWAEL